MFQLISRHTAFFSDGRVRFTGAFHDFHTKTDLTLQNDGQLKVILKWGCVLFWVVKTIHHYYYHYYQFYFLSLWYILGWLNMQTIKVQM